MDGSEDESKSIKISKKSKKKVLKHNQSSKKFASTEQRLFIRITRYWFCWFFVGYQ